MLALPTTDWRDRPYSEAEAEALAPVAATWRPMGEIEHVFTHVSLTLKVFKGACQGGDLIWSQRRDLDGLPSVFLKAARAGLGRRV